MVGESVVEASRKWVGEVFQDGLFKEGEMDLRPILKNSHA
jgi:hypothetical protein